VLRWGVCAVAARSLPGGAAGGARFGMFRLGEGRVPSRGKVPLAGERGVEVSRRPVWRRRVGHRRAGRRRAGLRRARRGCAVRQQPPPWSVAGDGAPSRKVRGEVVAFERFLECATKVHRWAPSQPRVRHPAGE
jgi:hypothetical protein